LDYCGISRRFESCARAADVTADLPANTQFLSPRLFMNNGATAVAIAYDCSGVYVETDY